MTLRIEMNDTRLSMPECAAVRRTKAAGPVEVTQYKGGKVVRHFVIPAPSDDPKPLPKPKRDLTINHHKPLDQSLVSAATKARRAK